MATTSTDSRSRPSAAIVTPIVDFLCCGGLSIVVVMALFAYSFINPQSRLYTMGIEFRDILILAVLINFPHFMASYRLLYESREQITEHSWASKYIPMLLVALVGYALLTPSADPENPEFANGAVVELLTLSGAFLLAWHYTGQAWGMTASFCFIGGIRMTNWERRLVRAGNYALMLFHVCWVSMASAQSSEMMFFSSTFGELLPLIQVVYFVATLMVLATIPVGVIGFILIRRRSGKWPPARAVVPWIAIYLWYFLIWYLPQTFLCLQIFHALQYLIFPLRVEVNRRQEQKEPKPSSSNPLVYAGRVYGYLLVAGLLVFCLPMATVYIGDEDMTMQALVVAFVNIHHYFIDGAIWKIRNPRVRKDLFAHLAS